MKLKKEVVNYLFFGVLTTVLNVACYQLLSWIFGEEWYLVNNAICWIVAVTFAFFTNKLWVFESKSWAFKVIRGEISGFLLARVFSLVLEEAGLFLMIDLLCFDALRLEVISFSITGTLIAKVIMQIIVVLSNYIFSKFLIF